MNDKVFLNELWIYAYKHQIDGYPLGHPRRTGFKPIVVTIPDGKGGVNRERTLEHYTSFSPEDKALLLAVSPSDGEQR